MVDSSLQTLRPGELGELLGVTSRTVRRWAAAGRFPKVERTLVGHHRFNPADVAKAYKKAGVAVPAKLAAYLKSVASGAAS